MRITKLIFLFLFWINDCSAQITNEGLVDTSTVSGKFRHNIINKQHEYAAVFASDTAKIKRYSLASILNKIDTDKSYHSLIIAKYWSSVNCASIIPHLIDRLSDRHEVGLKHYGDLIIWDRINAKQMKFSGHGSISADDVYTRAGRANDILVFISGERFGFVTMYSTPSELRTLQQCWRDWLDSLQK